jgi:uncharacterized protein YigE (DUF2233 family)
VRTIAGLFIAAFAFPLAAMARSGPVAEANPCAPASFQGYAYTICRAPLDRFAVSMFWRAPNGQPYRYLRALPGMEKEGRMVFALNAGMYDVNSKPVGLYVERGQELVAANTSAGPGNFHVKPNGIFWVKGGEAGVMETQAFLKAKLKPDFATQSGPMLVVNGRLNPRIANAFSSKKPRNGVCVRHGKEAIFAFSEEAVPFGDFARLFLGRLDCKNALFLDGGNAPALYLPAASRAGNTLVPLGPMIAVYERKQAVENVSRKRLK